MQIMHTMPYDTIAQRPKRRYYSPELKAQIVVECQVSGAVSGYLRDAIARLLMQRASQIGELLPNNWQRKQVAI